jgi:ATP-dependent Clp protease adaptor protein ClpS
MPEWEDDFDSSVIAESKQEVKKPPLYKVLLHNDDYTTMDFVVFILESVFHHTPEDANRIMWNVHRQGVGVAGVYTCEVAESKVSKVETLAREYEYPLLCTMEEE